MESGEGKEIDTQAELDIFNFLTYEQDQLDPDLKNCDILASNCVA